MSAFLFMNKKILKELYRRYKKFEWKIFLSRYEFENFWITEWEMRKQLRLLRRNWLNTVGKVYCGQPRFTNLYEISSDLLEYIKKQLFSVKNKFDICKFNKYFDLSEIVELRKYKKTYILFKTEKYKRTLDSETRVIARWCKKYWEHKWFNLFNWLKELWIKSYKHN